MRILIVENNFNLARSLERSFEHHGYDVSTVNNSKKALEMAVDSAILYKMIIFDLDIDEGREDKISFFKELRLKKNKIPVLVFNEEQNVSERIEVLESGASDYILKPFSLSQLMFKVDSILKQSVVIPTKSIDKLKFDFENKVVFVNKESITLTRKESIILHYLIKNSNQTLSREMIFENVWNFDSKFESNVVDVHMKNLRKKLSSIGGGDLIETMWGVGYRYRLK